VTVTSRSHWSNSAGVRIHAQEWTAPSEGQGLPIVFVPGGTGNALSGEHVGHDAASAAIGGRPRSLLAISRRGMGQSDTPPSGYTPRDFANDVQAAVTAAGYARFLLFGHSMGVPISLEFTLSHPDRVAALALGDTPAAYIDFKAAGTFEPLLKRRFEFSSWDDVYQDLVLRFDDRSRAPTRDVFDRDRHRFWVEDSGKIRSFISPRQHPSHGRGVDARRIGVLVASSRSGVSRPGGERHWWCVESAQRRRCAALSDGVAEPTRGIRTRRT